MISIRRRAKKLKKKERNGNMDKWMVINAQQWSEKVTLDAGEDTG